MVRATHQYQDTKHHRGFSFVEALVTAALVALVFGGLFAAVQAMISLIGDSKAKAGAVALATERLEFIRSLSYNDVGTVGAPPFGTIPQTRTVTLNNINYIERVVVRYEDDPTDGLDPTDSNGIPEDYKKVKVEYSWPTRSGTSSVALSTNVVPVGVETDVGGGSIRVYINDANVNPVPNAAVTITNTVLATTTNTTQFADSSGVFILSGLPAGGGYNISTTLPGYSIDGTATPTPPLSSPAQPIVSVAESAVTTQYFQIDRLSTLDITTASVPVYGSFSDTFTNYSAVATSSGILLAGGIVVLDDMSGSFVASGTIMATTSSPAPLDSWYSMDMSASTSASTSVRMQLRYPVGTSTELVPDTDLPGNSTGFLGGPVDITALSVTTYPELLLSAVLETIDATETPIFFDWSLNHIESQPSLSGIPITVTGTKTLGTDTVGGPVYKNTFTDSTDGSGSLTLSDIEYDVYTITVDDPSYDVVEACASDVISLLPNTTEVIDLAIASISDNRVRLGVTDIAGSPIAGASVRLQQGSFDETQTTSLCGQTFFSGASLTSGTSTVTIDKTGYSLLVDTTVPVNATATASVILN